MKVVYVAGPYRAKSIWDIRQNIRRAEEVALEVWKMGAACICPHKNTYLFDGAHGCHDNVWLDGDLEIIRRCDALLLVERWEQSSGTRDEVALAIEIGIPIFETLAELQEWLATETSLIAKENTLGPVIYISSHNQTLAKALRKDLQLFGYPSCSRWLDSDYPTTHAERQAAVLRNFEDIRRADAVVLTAWNYGKDPDDSAPRFCKGGKFVEVGYALGISKPVYILGSVENLLLENPTLCDFATDLQSLARLLERDFPICNEPTTTLADNGLQQRDLRTELWREYDFGGRVYRIDRPVRLYYREGGTTHRVLDTSGVVHCVPAPSHEGCALRWATIDRNVPCNF